MFGSLLSWRRDRRRPFAAMVAVLVLAVTASACEPPPPPPPENPPYWTSGAVTASLHGPLVRIQWPAPQAGDPESAYQINLGTYNGTVVALVPASVRDCYISGLAASTAHTIVVTARDAQMHWSGPLGTQGRRTTTITTSSHGGAGNSLWCHAAVDADGDGLPNGVETNDGSYTGAGDTGTNPNVADTDNDGLPDGEEALGIGGINLRALGTSPTHKDVLLEIDWTTTPACPTGYRPTAAAITELTTAFANGPVSNPDGVDGIKMIVDYGQGGVFTGGNAIPHDGSSIAGGPGAPEFVSFKAAHFDPARLGVFHYAVRLNGESRGERPGNDFTVGSQCNTPDHNLAGFIMHEIGHNFDLGHAGDWFIGNNFPNYNSIMNYRYGSGSSPHGVDTDCDGDRDGVLDYSRGLNADLNEAKLHEYNGICNGVDIDWDGDGNIEGNVQADIDENGQINFTTVFGEVRYLEDHDDWGLIESQGLTWVSGGGD